MSEWTPASSSARRRGSDEDQAFVQNLALFLTAFFRAHLAVLEGGEELRAALVQGLDTLVAISYVDDDEVRTFWIKVSIEPFPVLFFGGFAVISHPCPPFPWRWPAGLAGGVRGGQFLYRHVLFVRFLWLAAPVPACRAPPLSLRSD